MVRDPCSILITGGSSGIGAALAVCYAAPGVHLALGGRDPDRLEAVAEECRAAGADVAVRIVDVTDSTATESWIDEVETRRPIDLAFANAGVAIGTGRPSDLDRVATDTFAVNVGGVFNTVHPVLRHMAARGAGQIALVSSLAGFRGMPSSPAYCASKAAVRSYGEALRGWAGRHGVQVSVICPGFVRSGITDQNRFPMPFLMDADRAAAIIRRGLRRNRGRIAFPWPMYAIVWLMNSLPGGLVDLMTNRLPDKD